MIQRIQSVYLFAGALLLVLFVVLGEAWLGVVGVAFPWLTPVAYALTGLSALTALIAVFLYKQRDTQAKVILAAQWLTLLLVLVLAATFGILSFRTGEELSAAGITGLMVLLLPVVAYVCLSLARRGVKKDIALVRSMDRLR